MLKSNCRGVQAWRRRMELLGKGQNAVVRYYVDATGGDDGNSGLSPIAAWQTIGKVNGETFLPGDEILFKRGETWAEGGANYALLIDDDGAVGAPIIFGAYGTGADPVFDGEYTYPTKAPADGSDPNPPFYEFVYDSLVKLNASHVVFQNIELKRSRGRGLTVWPSKTDVQIRNCTIHDCRNIPILGVEASYITIDGCTVYGGGDYAQYDRGDGPPGYASAIGLDTCSNCTISNNTARESWTDGILIEAGCTQITVEDNTCYDNYSSNIYLEHTTHSVVRRNLCYNTNGTFLKNSDPPPNILIGDESGMAGDLCSDNDIYNNLCIGGNQNIAFFNGGAVGSGLIRTNVYHNTLVDAVTNIAGLRMGIEIANTGNHSNSNIKDNLICQDTVRYDQARDNGDASGEIAWDYNLWTLDPVDASVKGAHDQLDANAPVHFISKVTRDLHLTVDSLAIGTGTDAGIMEDYDGVVRGNPPDIGAYEYVA